MLRAANVLVCVRERERAAKWPQQHNTGEEEEERRKKERKNLLLLLY